MQINNNYSLNFSGSFRISPNELKAKAEIPNLFAKHRQILSNIKEQGDMFIVLRNNGADRRLFHYIRDNKVKGAEYYPTINTRSGLDDEKPELLKELLASGKHKFYSTTEQISKLIRGNAGNSEVQEPNELLSKIINTMRLNIENPKIKLSDAVAEVRDEDKKRTLYVISLNGTENYALLQYDNPNNDSMKWIIDKDGSIIKKCTEIKDLLDFNKKMKKLAALKINMLR